jgi:hypothetical protein
VPEAGEVSPVHAPTRRLVAAIVAVAAAGARVLPAQQEVPPDKSHLADAVRADLSKLSDLERAYFAANNRFTGDIAQLSFTPVSGASIVLTYASARTFSASASHVRLAPFLCFVIVSSARTASPADKPFCTDSRYGTAAAALARAGPAVEPPVAAAADAAGRMSSAGVTRVSDRRAKRATAKPAPRAAAPAVLTPADFAERLRAGSGGYIDSAVVTVQFAAKDARYDPSRGLLEIALERVPLPFAAPGAPGPGAARLAFACFTRPAFVCGASGLTYIGRDIFHVPPANAPDPEALRSGLTLQARFAIGRRDDTHGPALTLLALVLQSKGVVVAQWEAQIIP